MARTSSSARILIRAAPCALAAVLVLLAGSGCADLPHYSSTVTYYISPSGDDGASGTSPGTAWHSLARVQRVGLKPGDQVLLQGGAHYSGTLTVAAGEAGSAKRPVVIASYGQGHATIESSGDGIVVHDTRGVDIRDLTLIGKGAPYASGSGINLYSDLRTGSRPGNVTVSGVDVSGFHAGVAIGAAADTGFADVTINRAQLHGNEDAGLLTYGPALDIAHPVYAHQNIDIESVNAYDNPGDPTVIAYSTGSGIVLGSVSHGTVRGSSAHDNGNRSAVYAPEGPVGIWAYNATDVLVEHNIAYHNQTGSLLDGAGFGLDNNVSNSTLQYNLGYHNDGPGYYAFTQSPSGLYTGDTIRYNISADDGRKLPAHGALAVYGQDISGLQIYQNTLIMSGIRGVGPALLVHEGENGVILRNNILATDGSPLIYAPGMTTSQILLQGNDYYTPPGEWAVTWGGSTYTDPNSWRAATGQERLGNQPTGLTVNPCFSGGQLPEIQSAADARLVIPSCTALAGKGLSLDTLVHASPVTADYFGHTIGTPPPIGAAQPTPATPSSSR
jgi:hypothetical protein